MDTLWFGIGCLAFFWVVLWSLRDFSKPSRLFWPFDARWMERVAPPKETGWRSRRR